MRTTIITVRSVAFGTLTQLVLENAPVEEMKPLRRCAIPLACRLRWRNWILNRIFRKMRAPSRKPPWRGEGVKLIHTDAPAGANRRMKCTPRCWSPTSTVNAFAGMGICLSTPDDSQEYFSLLTQQNSQLPNIDTGALSGLVIQSSVPGKRSAIIRYSGTESVHFVLK